MHITLHGGKQYLAGTTHNFGSPTTVTAVDLRLQYSHGTLHGACRLDHLRQEHLTFAKQLAYPVHTLHERTVNDRYRLHASGYSLGYISGKMSLDTVNERIHKPLPYRQ